jgi:hypothetical protein
MAELIASGVIDATSSDITATAGAPITLFLKAAAGPLIPGDAHAVIQIKSADSVYFTVGELNRSMPARVLDGPGTYRVSKFASTTAFGVDQS